MARSPGTSTPTTESPPVCILKLGGAQARGPWLREWLDAIAAEAGRVVVVPGGGPFADAVREMQPVIGYDDEAAHDMAMSAMRQFGRALASLRPGFALVETEPELRAALASGQTPVWAPERMAREARLPASWELTSDSLALWLAGRLGAPKAILVKHARPASAAELARAGAVDPLFPAYLAETRVRAFLASPDAAARLGEGLDGEAYPEIRL